MDPESVAVTAGLGGFVSFFLLALQGVSEMIKRAAFLKGLIANPAEHKQESI